MSIFVLTIISLHIVFLAVSLWFHLSNKICQYLLLFNALFWFYSKISMYIFFLERLFTVFHRPSRYRFKSWQKIFLRS